MSDDLNSFLSIIAEGKKKKESEEIKIDAASDLNNLFSQLAEEKRKDPVAQKAKQIEQTISENIKSDLGSLFAELASLQKRVDVLPEETEGKVEAQQLIAEVLEDPVPSQPAPVDVSKYLTGKSFQQPNPDAPSKDIEDIRKKIKYLEQFLGKIAASGPGGGEVNFRYLDDVNRATMTESNDNWVLEYDAASKKVQFTKDIGPIDTVAFDTSHVSAGHPVGTLSWNIEDRTLNLQHANDVNQQIGQEQYFLVKNSTGSDILNGTVCMFAGAETANNSRLLATPYIADGTYPSLYCMGLATQDIPNGEEGFVTSFGRVGGLDTTAWTLGDILYADPFIPGGLTNIKPTAPNNVSIVCAVVKVDAIDGQVFVRPTIEQKMLYGRFSDTTDQIPALPNTPYAIQFDTTEVSRGIVSNTGNLPTSTITCQESGFYTISADVSLTSTNSSAKTFYIWLRKNGVDVPFSARRQSVSGNGTYQNLMYSTTMSLAKNDYFEIMYAVNDVTISINSPPATAFSPSIPSATLLVTQVAL